MLVRSSVAKVCYQVVIRRPDFSTREKSLGNVRKPSPLLKFGLPLPGRAEFADPQKEATKLADLDATGILDDEPVDRLMHADQPLLSDILCRNRHNSAATLADHLTSKRAQWLQEIQVQVAKTSRIRNGAAKTQPVAGSLASKLHHKTQSVEYLQQQGLAGSIRTPYAG